MKIGGNLDKKRGRRSVAVTVQDREFNWSKSVSVQDIDGKSLFLKIKNFLKQLAGEIQ